MDLGSGQNTAIGKQRWSLGLIASRMIPPDILCPRQQHRPLEITELTADTDEVLIDQLRYLRQLRVPSKGRQVSSLLQRHALLSQFLFCFLVLA